MCRALPGGGQAGVIAAEQLGQDVLARAFGLRHLHQRRADQVRDHDHLQQVRLFDQGQATGFGQGRYRCGNTLDKRLAGEDHQPGNRAFAAFLDQLQQVGFIAGMVDTGDKHQLTAHHPAGDALVLGHI